MSVRIRAAVMFLLAGLCPAIAMGAAGVGHLTISVAPAHPILGHPLQLTVRAVDAPRSLAQISLAPLRAQFRVRDVVSGQARTHRGSHPVTVATLSMALYPRRAGRVRIPSLHLGAWASRAHVITVAPTGPPGSVIRVRSGVEHSRLWVRQETLVFIDIYDDARGVSAQLAHWHPSGAFVRPLATRTRRVREHGVTYNVTRLAWAVMPLRPGGLTLKFPMLQVQSRASSGQVLWYPVAPIHVRGRALPSYIPVSVPVGRVRIASALPTGRLWPGRQYTWHLRVSGPGLDLSGLRTLLGPQLRSPPGVHLYHPLYQRVTHRRGGTFVQSFRVSVPFAIKHSGVRHLPALSLPFLDVRTGKLQTERIASTVLQVSNPLLVGLGWAIGAVAILGVLGVLVTWGWLRWRRHAARRTAVHAMLAARSAKEMTEALLDWQPRGEGRARTLAQWRRQRHVSGEALAREMHDTVGCLEHAGYGPGPMPDDLSVLRQRLAALIRQL